MAKKKAKVKKKVSVSGSGSGGTVKDFRAKFIRLTLSPSAKLARVEVSPDAMGVDPRFSASLKYCSTPLREVNEVMSELSDNPSAKAYARVKRHPMNPLIWRVVKVWI